MSEHHHSHHSRRFAAKLVHLLTVALFPLAGSSLIMTLVTVGVLKTDSSRAKFICGLVAFVLTVGYYVVVYFSTRKLRHRLTSKKSFRRHVRLTALITVVPYVLIGYYASDLSWTFNLWTCCLPMVGPILVSQYEIKLIVTCIILFFIPAMLILFFEHRITKFMKKITHKSHEKGNKHE